MEAEAKEEPNEGIVEVKNQRKHPGVGPPVGLETSSVSAPPQLESRSLNELMKEKKIVEQVSFGDKEKDVKVLSWEQKKEHEDKERDIQVLGLE